MTESKVKEIVRVYPGFKQGVISGFGWALGVTLGFVLISTVLVFIARQLVGIPLLGEWIANIVLEVEQQLGRRTPGVFPQ